ncbi:MAG: ribonuclease Z [Bacteroidetes bacterium]|nr:ribonuclease Z [Bacteroidota bacterium]MBU1720390.1 ribonuclease Z [Bacteroidota bacterium]
MLFSLTILGSGSALPTAERNHTAQVLQMDDRVILIDCGEGTQHQLRRFGIKFQKINHIYISHLHGDHYLGLAGLLSTFHLQGRTRSLTIFGPKGLEEITRLQFDYAETKPGYPIEFVTLTDDKYPIYEDKVISVEAHPVPHRIPCWAFYFKEKPKKRNINKEAVDSYNIPISAYDRIKNGGDFVLPDGTVLKNTELTYNPPPRRSYAFVTDTGFNPVLAEKIHGVNLLYHEATFLHDMTESATDKFHSTARQAAEFAELCEAGQLVIGHFSTRYKNADLLLQEAREVFPNTFAAEDGMEILIAV